MLCKRTTVKKLLSLALSVILLLCILSLSAFANALSFSEMVEVSIAAFDVILNGEKYDSEYSEYPFLVYDGNTYLPLTYDNLEFLGLNFRLYENEDAKDGIIDGISVYNAPIRSDKLEIYKRENKNPDGTYFAEIQNIAAYVNLNATGNKSDSHNSTRNAPILFFRNIYYIPLENNLVVNALGWNYSYDYNNGLYVDSKNAVRPDMFDDSCLLCEAEHRGCTKYYISHNGYLEFKSHRNEGESFGDFTWHFKGGEKKSFDFTEQLGDVKYLDAESGAQGLVEARIKPTVDENIFVLMGVKYLPPNSTIGYISNVLIVIDLEKCEVLCCVEIQ